MKYKPQNGMRRSLDWQKRALTAEHSFCTAYWGPAVVWCFLQNPSTFCDVSWPNVSKNKHLSISHRCQISCVCSCTPTGIWWVKVALPKPWCLPLCMWSSPLIYFPASRSAVLWMKSAWGATLPSYYNQC